MIEIIVLSFFSLPRQAVLDELVWWATHPLPDPLWLFLFFFFHPWRSQKVALRPAKTMGVMGFFFFARAM